MAVSVTTRPRISSHLTTLRSRRLRGFSGADRGGLRVTAGPSARRLLNSGTPVFTSGGDGGQVCGQLPEGTGPDRAPPNPRGCDLGYALRGPGPIVPD